MIKIISFKYCCFWWCSCFLLSYYAYYTFKKAIYLAIIYYFLFIH